MSASEAAVRAAQKELGCFGLASNIGRPSCHRHPVAVWTDRGCPVAVAVADAVAAIAARETRRNIRRYCGCAWCCTSNPPDVVPGERHRNCARYRAATGS